MSENSAKCPIMHGTTTRNQSPSTKNSDWWPEQLNLNALRTKTHKSNPNDRSFDYAKAFSALDLGTVKSDLADVMTNSQDWWPADYGHYGPFMIRMAWHSAGTYRSTDGRGGGSRGSQRFAPLNSWPDNGNLDKARRLLWPIKQKYGNSLSWADLYILAGNVALESMGFATFGFSGGREDIWEAESEINWGLEKEWLTDKRYQGERDLDNPLAAVEMGLIYVNPEGPNGDPNVLASAVDIRETFARMGMNDEETVALVAGGHTFGKAHGAGDPTHVGPEPEAASIQDMGFGWLSSFGSGHGDDTITSGIEGAWTAKPTQWDNGYFDLLFGYEWNLTKSPSGAWIWEPVNPKDSDLAPAAHDASIAVKTMMTTADMAMRMDPAYGQISKRFHANPDAFAQAFAKAWFKLTHRDMGPKTRYVGSEVPSEEFVWQDPIPAIDFDLVNDTDITALKAKILASDISLSDLVFTAWASASTYRGADRRGGANGARIRFEPQNQWEANEPERIAPVLAMYESLKAGFDQAGKKVAIADLIVLGGAAAIEQAASNAGTSVEVPFSPGRNDALAEQTDAQAFAVLEPIADGFRNYIGKVAGKYTTDLLIDKAELLGLSVPEMTALVGGMRSLGANFHGSSMGVLGDAEDALNNDFFVNLMDMSTQWSPSEIDDAVFEGHDRASGELKYSASHVDLIFGSNSELRAIAEFFAQDDNQQAFVETFVKAWNRVMNADRFDLL